MNTKYALQQGAKAYHAMLDRDDNPHQPGTLAAEDWQKGWMHELRLEAAAELHEARRTA